MEILKEKLTKNSTNKQLRIYCATFLLYGAIFSGIQPYLDIFNQKMENHQSKNKGHQLYCLAGFILGAVCLKSIHKKLTMQKVLLCSLIAIGILCLLLGIVITTMYEALIFFCMSFIGSLIWIITSMSILKSQKRGEIQLWMFMGYGILSIGSLIGSQIVTLFNGFSYLFLGIACFGIAVLSYHKLNATEKLQQGNNNEQQVDNNLSQIMLPQYRNLNNQLPIIIHIASNEYINKPTQIIICCICAMFSGVVKFYDLHFSQADKVSGGQYAFHLLFLAVVCVSRFVVGLFLGLRPFEKLFIFGYLFIFSAFLVSLCGVIELTGLGWFMGCFMFGMCLSTMLPLIMSVSEEYQMELSVQQCSNIMISMALGEIVLSSIIKYFSQLQLFQSKQQSKFNVVSVSTLIISIVIVMLVHYLKGQFEKEIIQRSSSSTRTSRQQRKTDKTELIQMLMINK